VTREAELVERATPKFPPRAKRLDVYEGMVLIEFTIDRNGAVRNPKVAQAKPSNVFEETALNAIQKFRFRPKLVDNVPVESRSRFTFRFKEEE
jgi:protein TonB